MLVTIRGKRYRLRFVPGLKHYGMCDAPDKAGKEIKVRRSLRGQLKLDTIIHECLHAALWDLGEESIDQAATDIARVLTRLGYRDGSEREESSE